MGYLQYQSLITWLEECRNSDTCCSPQKCNVSHTDDETGRVVTLKGSSSVRDFSRFGLVHFSKWK